MADVLLSEELIVGKDNDLEVKGDLDETREMMALMTRQCSFQMNINVFSRDVVGIELCAMNALLLLLLPFVQTCLTQQFSIKEYITYDFLFWMNGVLSAAFGIHQFHFIQPLPLLKTCVAPEFCLPLWPYQW